VTCFVCHRQTAHHVIETQALKLIALNRPDFVATLTVSVTVVDSKSLDVYAAAQVLNNEGETVYFYFGLFLDSVSCFIFVHSMLVHITTCLLCFDRGHPLPSWIYSHFGLFLDSVSCFICVHSMLVHITTCLLCFDRGHPLPSWIYSHAVANCGISGTPKRRSALKLNGSRVNRRSSMAANANRRKGRRSCNFFVFFSYFLFCVFIYFVSLYILSLGGENV
jgi:hypothetical protein